MKLYHGTSESVAHKATKEGLKPRAMSKTSNWSKSPSNKNCVYLTDAYPLYFSMVAVNPSSENKERLAIIEVNSDELFETLLVPDEDVLEQAGRGYDHVLGLGKDWPMERRTRWYKKRLLSDYSGEQKWKQSLGVMGTCAYHGMIPSTAITRVALIDYSKQKQLCFAAMDASITIANYKFCSKQYKLMLDGIFGGEMNYDEKDPFSFGCKFIKECLENRDGIEIIDVKENSES